jgi:hypothetical protein
MFSSLRFLLIGEIVSFLLPWLRLRLGMAWLAADNKNRSMVPQHSVEMRKPLVQFSWIHEGSFK